jgi:2-keto-4-pentenoate hydratase
MIGGRAVAQRFVEARRAGTALEAYPGPVPGTLADAYAIQDAAIELWREPPRGWKVGRIGAPYDVELATDRLAGPIFRVEPDGSDVPVFAQGFAAAEAEIVLRIGAPLPPWPDVIDDDLVRELIDAAFIGIEVASSPLGAVNDLGPMVTISDFGNNQALVLGEEIPDWQNAGIDAWPVMLGIDGRVVGEGRASAMPGGPLGAVKFLLRTLAERGIAVPAGTLVSTGAITGIHPVRPGDAVVATFDGRRSVGCTISGL